MLVHAVLEAIVNRTILVMGVALGRGWRSRARGRSNGDTSDRGCAPVGVIYAPLMPLTAPVRVQCVPIGISSADIIDHPSGFSVPVIALRGSGLTTVQAPVARTHRPRRGRIRGAT